MVGGVLSRRNRWERRVGEGSELGFPGFYHLNYHPAFVTAPTFPIYIYIWCSVKHCWRCIPDK